LPLEAFTMRRQLALFAVLFLVVSCAQRRETGSGAVPAMEAPSRGMTISSPAFAGDGSIPAKYGCEGNNMSPPLAFSALPPNAKTLALVVEDPDAPGALFTHWVVWNIPPSTVSVAEAQPPAGGVEGQNSYGQRGYGTLCPPSGEHRYFFELYALDATLNLPGSNGRAQLESAMKGHIVAEAQLMGRYRVGR
jgi:Raf kinase inhibitor-like YbhB/YbcL family protein